MTQVLDITDSLVIALYLGVVHKFAGEEAKNLHSVARMVDTSTVPQKVNKQICVAGIAVFQ